MYLEEHLEGVCILLMMHSDFNPSPVPQRKKSLLDGQFSQPLSWLGWMVPQTVLYICFRVSRGFSGKSRLPQKRFCGGFPQLFSVFVSQMAVAS